MALCQVSCCVESRSLDKSSFVKLASLYVECCFSPRVILDKPWSTRQITCFRQCFGVQSHPGHLAMLGISLFFSSLVCYRSMICLFFTVDILHYLLSRHLLSFKHVPVNYMSKICLADMSCRYRRDVSISFSQLFGKEVLLDILQ
jgi:hypothetical protein